ncbi:hypothetical protein [Paenibacillus tengchongensis]|uniref:hypothetical protein n=1 Tax=Paenibacillus tengchongensis TaxID=2608684 RepID=UPI00124DCE55|nr:hypothetical protein [Paenibacillus tengchongensis]
MNTSSFLCGVVMGAAASMIISKKRGSMMSALLTPGGAGQGAGEKAKDKILGMAGTGFGSSAQTGDAAVHEHKPESTVITKESNLRLLKDFIRSNPDVKHEVEKILKETHTTIPGL